MSDKMLLTVPEAALRLGVGRSFLYNLVIRGEIASVKLGRARRIPVQAIEEFVKRLQADEKSMEYGSQPAGEPPRSMPG